MSITNLREYQKIAIQQIQDAWDEGVKNVLFQLHTGGGKTVIAAEIFNQHADYAIAIAHRSELVSQLSLTLAKFGIYHDLIAAKTTRKTIIALHMSELGKSYYRPGSVKIVSSVDTLIRTSDARFSKITLVLQDEAHHVLRKNKWGIAAKLFPQAKGLYLTATPVRADGCGLGAQADGVIDRMILGPPMRYLIESGYLTDYRLIAPASDINLADVTITSTGEYSPNKLRTAVRKSRIVGDVVENYIKFASGKSGITFTVSLENAAELMQAYRDANISAEVISGKTPDLLRANIIKRFKNKEILQLVSVDILGEGIDIPGIEVISMARPTQSFAVYAQQFGRALRPLPGKKHAIIIDHVGNTLRHRLPDYPRVWSLYNLRQKKSSETLAPVIPLRTCGNVECLGVYEGIKKTCPYCGFFTPPAARSLPENVDGDLTELSEDALQKLRGLRDKIDSPPKVSYFPDPIVQLSIMKRHRERSEVQQQLRDKISQWAGYQKQKNLTDSEIYRKFYFLYGIDILTAQTLGSPAARKLIDTIDYSN